MRRPNPIRTYYAQPADLPAGAGRKSGSGRSRCGAVARNDHVELLPICFVIAAQREQFGVGDDPSGTKRGTWHLMRAYTAIWKFYVYGAGQCRIYLVEAKSENGVVAC